VARRWRYSDFACLFAMTRPNDALRSRSNCVSKQAD